MKNTITMLCLLCAISVATAQTNKNANPVNAQPATTVVPVTKPNTIPNTPSRTKTVNAIKPQDTMTPTSSPAIRNLKNDTKPSTINGNANTNQHITTPGNTRTDPAEVDHTLPPGKQKVDGTTLPPAKN